MEGNPELSSTFINLKPDQKITKIYESHCLIGKILLHRQLDQTLVKISAQAEWQCKNGLDTSQISRNMFVFIFQDKQDLANVLKKRPWTIMGGLLMLSDCVSGQVPSEPRFSHSPFWVQAHGLPMDYLTKENWSKIGDLFGEFVYTDWEICAKLFYRKFLRLRVVLDVRKPIKTGFWLKRAGLKDIWIDFKYEKLGLFCYKCGLIGNGYNTCNCKFPFGDAKFGPWLRADSWEPGSIPNPNRICKPTVVDTGLDPNVCATLLAVPKFVQPPNLGDVDFELQSVSTDYEETEDETEIESETTNNRRKMWQRLIFHSIDSTIMLANCGVVFWRIESVDRSEGIWTLSILIAAYLFNVLRKLVCVRRGLKLDESRNKMVPCGDGGTNNGRAVGEILILVLFLVFLISF